MNSLLIDKKLILAVSAIDISNQELVVGTTRVFDYDVTIDSVELEDAHLDYCIWLYLMSGWQI